MVRNKAFISLSLLLHMGKVIVVLVVGLLALSACSSAPQPTTGNPHLSVDRDSVDLGRIAFNQATQADFSVENTGAGSLQILGEPQVELVQGC
ncbi:MAG: hypothetical protein EXR62_09565 [Chloroflexi bacterium]|nr:hypothetical protein [Chloroflexota bacterium]